MKDNYASWDDIWRRQRYLSDYALRWYTYLRRLSKDIMPERAKVLEAGCGRGAGIAIFSRDGHQAFGLDISPVAIEKARKEYQGVNFICKDLFDMPFEDEEFDLVYNSGLIEHFKYPGNIEAIKAMGRVLKPGGRLIIAVPNSLCLWYVLGKKLLVKTGRWAYGFEDSYSPALLKRYIGEVRCIRLKRIFGLQPFPMFALPNFELIPLRYRKAIVMLERLFPFKHFYSYAIVAEAVKESNS